MVQINACAELGLDDGVALTTIDHPPVNASAHAARDGLLRALTTALADDAVRAIVLSCQGRTFFAGADITECGKPPLRSVA